MYNSAIWHFHVTLHTVFHDDDNICLQAIQLDPEFAKNIGQILILGGAFAVNGNVNPAAEANVSISILHQILNLQYKYYIIHNSICLTLWLDLFQIFGYSEAADVVFTSGVDVLAVGINVTHQVVLTGTPFDKFFCAPLLYLSHFVLLKWVTFL